jgi:hypothetical protein
MYLPERILDTAIADTVFPETKSVFSFAWISNSR